MFSLTVRDFVAAGVTAAVAFIVYLVKRRIERKRHSESLGLDKQQLELIDYYLTNKGKWEASGQFVEVPASIAGKVSPSLTPQQWDEYYTSLAAHHIRSLHSTCMWFESIAATHPDYQFALDVHRNEFLRWYNANVQCLPAVFDFMPKQVASIIHSYYHYVTNPTEANTDGFSTALWNLQKAMFSGEIIISQT
jgi:hypothetical protein